MLRIKKISTVLMAAVLVVSMTPLPAEAADAQHYELTMWKADGTGINFTFQGPMGTLRAGIPCGEIMYSHAKDPSWTGADSVAPILAYIKANGITSDIKECMNPTVFDPSVIQALSAQGVSLSTLGGPDNPTAGKAIIQMPAASAHLVGLGIPTPDLNNLSSTPTPKALTTPTPTPAPVQSKQPTATTPTSSTSTSTTTPNTPIPHESTPNEISPATQPQTSVKAVIPPANTEVATTTPTGPIVPPKVVPPDLLKKTQTTTQSPWKKWLYVGIAAVVALCGGAFGIIKWKRRNA